MAGPKLDNMTKNSLKDLKLTPKDVSVNVSAEISPSREPDAGSLERQTRTRKLFSLTQLLAFLLGYMTTWASVMSNLSCALYNGGPRTLLITYIVVFAGALGQFASLCEMASMQPIAGTQYHWTWALSVGKT